MYHFIGSDPDLHFPNAVSVCTSDFEKFKLADTVSVTVHGKGCDAVSELVRFLSDLSSADIFPPFDYKAFAVEEVEVVTSSRRNANPQSMVPVAHSAGVMALWVSQGCCPHVWFVQPQAWKGSQPKKINQARTCSALGLPYKLMGGKSPYCVPTGDLPECFQGFKDSAWKHLLDSAGLAIWAGRRWNTLHGPESEKRAKAARQAERERG